MSAESRAESAFLVLAILALFGLLILLIGSLDELTFQPGKHLPRSEAVDEDAAITRPTIPKTKPQRSTLCLDTGRPNTHLRRLPVHLP